MTSKEIILQLKDDRYARQSILTHFLQDDSTIKDLIELSTTKDAYPIQEHSTWILIHASDLYPKKINVYQTLIIDAFLEADNQTTMRNLCKILSQLPLIEYKEGILLDQLISHFKNLDNKVALHVYCLEKLNQYVKKYPEIKSEIKEIIDLKKEQGLAPSMARVLKDFEKLK